MTSRIIIAGATAALTALGFLLSTPAPAADQVPATYAATILISADQARNAGDTRRAIALYKQAHEAAPGDSAPLTAWGLLAAELGADEQAASLLTAALEADPANATAAAVLAETLVFLDRQDEALALYDAMLESVPGDPEALAGRATVAALIAELQPLEQPDPTPASEIASADREPALLVRTGATAAEPTAPTWR